VPVDRPKDPPKSLDDDDFFGDAFPSESPTAKEDEVPEDRPTVSPPFDLEEYARHSDSKVRTAVKPEEPPPEPVDTSTKPPPPDFDLGLDDIPTRPPQATLTDENEIERARLKSVLMPSDPPPKKRDPLASFGPPAPAEEEPAPPTVAYPPDLEKDPFASLGGPRKKSSAEITGPVREMRDRFSLGDYSGALEIAEQLLDGDPGNEEAAGCAEQSRGKLLQMYTAKIGPLDRVPMVIVPREQLRWLSIDHRAGFLLSHIDGVSSLEMILDVSGMPLLDALKILCELAQQRVIGFR
jgi:hypothetical protein